MMKERCAGKKGMDILFLSMIYAVLCITLACVPEEEIITANPEAKLSFSKDTVLFDTLFSTVGSITKDFKVYNPNQNAVAITSIELAKGSSSAYKVYVNGEHNERFTGVQLLGGDSLLVLVEVFIDSQDENLPFLVKDSLVFTTNQHVQDVKLVAWGQDAHFIKSLFIRKDTTLTGERPYVIYDSIWIEEDAALHIEKGSRLYFNQGSGLVVNGSLQVTGTAEERVLFRNDRADGTYENGLGQWKGIIFSHTSTNNKVNFAVIRNAEIGLGIEGADTDSIPDISVTNTMIENMSVGGLVAINADIDAYNLLINNCVASLVANFGRGYYRYFHCTFANDFTNFSREGPALLFTDTLSEAINQPFQLVLENNIIWGNRPDELTVITEEANSQVTIRSNLIKTRNESAYAEQNILNEDPQFVNPFQYNYQIDSTSVAIDQGLLTQVKKDIDGNVRDSIPDLGAYEYIKK